MLRIAICDDEKTMLEKNSKFIRKILMQQTQYFDVVKFSNGEELLDSHRKEKFDILFLDIDMPQISGLLLAEKIRDFDTNVLIIFISCLDNCVYESLRVQPYRFIRKSHIDELEEAVTASAKYVLTNKVELSFTGENGTFTSVLADIMAFTSIGHRIYLCTKNEKLRINMTLNSLEDKFKDYGFIRIHKSYIVNYRCIDKVSGDSVILEDKSELPISRRRYRFVREEIMRLYKGEG